MSQDNELLCFKAITNFVNDLGEIFSNRQHSLKLYSRLVKKTTLSHEVAINKHIEVFKNFCITNRVAIQEKNKDKLKQQALYYSEKVGIDFEQVFKLASSDDRETIWNHLLFISTYVDPASKARDILKKEKTSETDFLSNIFEKVEKEVDPNADPMQAITSMMQSGVMTELVQGMNSGLSNGTLDINKLVGSVQSMIGKLNENDSGGTNGSSGSDPMNMISGLMSSLNSMTTSGEGTGDSSSPLDLGNMMNIMGMLNPAMMASSGSKGSLT